MKRFISALVNLRPKRWLTFLFVAALCHLLLIQQTFAPFSVPMLTENTPLLISANLLPPPLATVAPPEPTPPVPVRKAKPRRIAAAAKPPEAAAAKPPEAVAAKPPEAVAANEPPLAEIADPSLPKDGQDIVPSTTPSPPEVASPTDGKQILVIGENSHYSINPPPSATLQYKAHSQHKGQDIYGSGNIQWVSDGNRFSIKGEFNVLFLNLLNFSSEGTIDPKTGVSPTIYAEKRFRKAETNTHFHRERNTISFSASTNTYERPGGEQDRASVIWQLVGIGRRHPDKFVPGSSIEIAVAGARSADVWRIDVIGVEEIETGMGRMRSWHLAHKEHLKAYDQSVDVWLAPEYEWYPAKVRYTNANGDFLDLSLNEVAAPGR